MIRTGAKVKWTEEYIARNAGLRANDREGEVLGPIGDLYQVKWAAIDATASYSYIGYYREADLREVTDLAKGYFVALVERETFVALVECETLVVTGWTTEGYTVFGAEDLLLMTLDEARAAQAKAREAYPGCTFLVMKAVVV